MQQFSIRTLAAFVAFVAIVAAASSVLIGPAVPKHLLQQIEIGMTKSEIKTIMGPPTRSYGNHEWQYSRTGNVGWVEIWFDENGAVNGINDESAFP